MTAVLSSHVELDQRGIAWVSGTRVKVSEIARDRRACDWSAEEIQHNHPELSLAEIYASLAFYYDNQSEIDRQIDLDLVQAERISRELSSPSFRSRLVEAKHAE